MVRILFCIFFCLILSLLYAPAAKAFFSVSQLSIESPSKQNWISTTTASLRKIASPNQESVYFEKSITAFDDFYQCEFVIKGSGYVVLSPEQWIYFVSHSSHQNEEIGDITLAIDNAGRIYSNTGHICGGRVSFKTRVKFESLTAFLFFENFVSDSDEKSWITID